MNVMMPIIAHDLLQSIELEANASRVFAEKCILGITADAKRCRELGEKSAALVTAIAPAVGYDNAAKIFKKALDQDKSIRQVILEDKILDQKTLDEVLDMKKLTEGGRMA